VTAKQASKAAKLTGGWRQEPVKMFRVRLYARRMSSHDRQTLPLRMRAMPEYAAKKRPDNRSSD
jgi:hypothetical protein